MFFYYEKARENVYGGVDKHLLGEVNFSEVMMIIHKRLVRFLAKFINGVVVVILHLMNAYNRCLSTPPFPFLHHFKTYFSNVFVGQISKSSSLTGKGGVRTYVKSSRQLTVKYLTL